MAVLYVVSALTIIGFSAAQIPAAVQLIVSSAFSMSSVTGGMVGAIVVGFQRALFSNEAGIGSASIAHSAVQTNEPASEGLVGLLEPFLDTVVGRGAKLAELGALSVRPGAAAQPPHTATSPNFESQDGDAIDVALRVGPEIDESDSVMVRKVMETRQYLVAAPSLLAERGPCTTIEELRAFPTLDISTPGGRHTWLLHAGDGRSISHNHQPRLISDDIETLRRAAHAGAGVVRISERMIHDDLEAGRLVAVLPEWSLRANQVYLAFLASKGLTPSVRAFVEYVCATLPDAVRRAMADGSAVIPGID